MSTAFTAYAAIPAMNWSSLSAMASSPRLYRARASSPRRDTPSFALGRAIHCAVLEPTEYPARYADYPGAVRRGREWEAWQLAHPGAIGLSAPERATAEACRAAVLEHAEARRLLSGCRTEETVLWTDEATGVACKGRLDAVAPSRLVDLKTSRLPLERFARSAATYLYHGQLAWYLDGARAAKALPYDAAAYIVAVETTEPHDVAAWVLPEELLDAGRRLYRRLLELYVECSAADLWPGRYPTIQEMYLPEWADGMQEDDEAF